jgi:hypothetical protein
MCALFESLKRKMDFGVVSIVYHQAVLHRTSYIPDQKFKKKERKSTSMKEKANEPGF